MEEKGREGGDGQRTKKKKNKKKGWHAPPRAMQANAVDAVVHVAACMHVRMHARIHLHVLLAYTYTCTHTHTLIRVYVQGESFRLARGWNRARGVREEEGRRPRLSSSRSLCLSPVRTFVRSYRCAEGAPGGRRAVLHPTMKWWRGGGARSFRCGRGNERR